MLTFSGFTWIQVLTLLVSVVLPAIVALVTQRAASPGTKAIALALLAAVIGFLSELLDALVNSTAYDVGAALFTWVTSFIVAVVVHYGLLKPLAITGSNGSIQASTPYVGVGGRHSRSDL